MAVTADQIFNSESVKNALDNFEKQLDDALIRAGATQLSSSAWSYVSIAVPQGMNADILNKLKSRYTDLELDYHSGDQRDGDPYISCKRKNL